MKKSDRTHKTRHTTNIAKTLRKNSFFAYLLDLRHIARNTIRREARRILLRTLLRYLTTQELEIGMLERGFFFLNPYWYGRPLPIWFFDSIMTPLIIRKYRPRIHGLVQRLKIEETLHWIKGESTQKPKIAYHLYRIMALELLRLPDEADVKEDMLICSRESIRLNPSQTMFIRFMVKRQWETGNISWLQSLFDEVLKNRDTRGYYEGTFRFLRRRPKVVGKAPRPNYVGPFNAKALYFLHSSLPYVSSGYATRGHGILKGLKSTAWEVTPYTRLNFPGIIYALGVGTLPLVNRVEDITYYRMLDGSWQDRMRKVPQDKYISRYRRAVNKLIDYHKPSVVHVASNYLNGYPVIEAARRAGVPSVYEVRGLWEVTRATVVKGFENTELFRFYKRMETHCAQTADRVIAITESLKEELIRRGVDGSKIRVIPNGVYAEKFNPIPRDTALARKLGIKNEVVIGFIGSVVDYEGLDDLAHAALKLKKLIREPFKILIVGDGAALTKVRKTVAQMDLTKNVIFTGRVPFADVPKYYSLIDIAPFPRKPLAVCEMVSPLKPFEAMAMQKAVLVSSVKAQLEIVNDGVTGMVFQKGDVDHLAAKLKILITDPGVRESLGRMARQWILNERTWGRLAGKVADVYSELITPVAKPVERGLVIRNYEPRDFTPQIDLQG